METAEDFKKAGNEAFSANNFGTAVEMYSKAIDLDKENHILYSNRSAAFLGRNGPGDATFALSDAQACIRLNPSFLKGYSRKGQALQALSQYQEAYLTFQAGLKVDPTNESMKEGMDNALQLIQKERARQATALNINTSDSDIGAADKGQTEATKAVTKPEEDDPLAEFMNEISEIVTETTKKNEELDHLHAEVREKAIPIEKEGSVAPSRVDFFGNPIDEGSSTTLIKGNMFQLDDDDEAAREAAIKAVSTGNEYVLSGAEAEKLSADIANADLGTPEGQTERLFNIHSKWLRLNPFEMLMLPYCASENDIKARYRKLSALVHPDKNPHERAADAFDELKSAYDALMDPNRRRIAAALMKNTFDRILRERQTKSDFEVRSELDPAGNIGPGFSFPEKVFAIEVKKAFADSYHRKEMFEYHVKLNALRDAKEATADFERQAEEAKAEVEWAKNRENRKSSWLNFEQVSKKRKLGSDVDDETLNGDIDAHKKKWR